MGAVVFYVSAHGFGHAARQIEVINALAARDPGCRIAIRTSAPRWLFDRTVRAPFTWLDGPCDTGVVQIDSLHLDARATIEAAAAFHRTLPERAAAEAATLRAHGARAVVADAPPLGPAAAAAADIPSVVLSNFTWDWIYGAYRDELQAAPELIPAMQAAYRAAGQGWRLPMHGGFDSVAPIVDLPWVARHARHDRQTVRTTLSLPTDRPLALSSFGGYGVRHLDLGRLDCLADIAVVITGRAAPADLPRGVHFIDERRIYAAGLRYEDLVAAVDVVVTKPGYGIISECIANQTAMLYTSRGAFREYDVMTTEMPAVVRCGFITNDALLDGRWHEPLIDVLRQPPPPTRPRTDGAEIAAALIGELIA